MKRYIGINCSKCGRFVGKDGFYDYDAESREIGYPLCARCLKAQGPTLYDMEVEHKELTEEFTHASGSDKAPLLKRIANIEQKIAQRKNSWKRSTTGAQMNGFVKGVRKKGTSLIVKV